VTHESISCPSSIGSEPELMSHNQFRSSKTLLDCAQCGDHASRGQQLGETVDCVERPVPEHRGAALLVPYSRSPTGASFAPKLPGNGTRHSSACREPTTTHAISPCEDVLTPAPRKKSWVSVRSQTELKRQHRAGTASPSSPEHKSSDTHSWPCRTAKFSGH